MKRVLTFLSAGLMLFMMSCNNEAKPAEEKTVAAANTAAAFTPYKAMIFQHTVSDYDKWYGVFAGNDSMRKSFGIGESSVGRGLDDDKLVIVLNIVKDIKSAKDFAASPGLNDAMMKAGVISPPTISYLDVISEDTSNAPQKERLMVVHHVKDFDAWKKAFDMEGKDARTANGLVELAIARGVDDPNTVTVVFAVTDMVKAKARVGSAELKKIMADAGVDGPPQITWFKWVTP